MFGKVVAQYKNGNYQVAIMSDGTKVRFGAEPDGAPMIPDYPETIDMCITKACNVGCKFCYENCKPHGPEMPCEFMSYAIWDDIPPYTELALNGNDLDLRCLSTFLEMLQRKNIIVNMTFSFSQWFRNSNKINNLLANNLLNSIGISLGNMEFIQAPHINVKQTLSHLPSVHNVVFHAILGVTKLRDLVCFAERYKDAVHKDPNLLILGYKTKGRGDLYDKLAHDSIIENAQELDHNMEMLNHHFAVVSFDNLACEQLNMKGKLSPEEWDMLYMGEDGQYSMYIDAVNLTYSRNSCTPESERIELKNTDSLKNIFQTIRSKQSITDVKFEKTGEFLPFESSVLDNGSAPIEL